ncbi:AzlC family ABC transporter permease [Noviherbaspirillum saxi]|uniref:Branched-chain amino acid ABC transporter permease n=1 Tax=Noviherbaspirillum saxi TaxID=2320863 RepID=A0A3A3FNY4_9BURK|nr:AzlC family ABC transporter permease [Noviherbaspirillum saxi]RJF97892.1 branched-chain amino acid ABC transporter permease [Noviherbaspirillum saxi]
MSNTQASTTELMSAGVEKRAFRDGFKACAPTIPGIFAWGMVAGMAMVKSDLSILQSLGMTFLVFAGSAQLASLPLMAANVPLSVVFLTALVVNLRFVIFAAAIAPHFAHLPWYKRLWHGYFNADVTMGLFPQRFPAETVPHKEGKVGYFTGIGYPNWCAWQSGSVAGILLASQIPQSWGIGFAGTLALLAITIPLTINMAALAGVVVAGAVAVAAAGLPYKLGLLVAVIVGMMAAMAVDTVLDRKKGEDE